MKLLIFLLFVGTTTVLIGQPVGIGVSGIYNLQTESIGFGLRGAIYGKRVNIIPQVAYYPSFNKVHEIFLGIGAEYNAIIEKNVRFYALGHGAFNAWLNHENSTKKNAQLSNWAAEVGLGVAGRNCWQPFLEYRYNVKWQETNLRVGITYILRCKSGGYTCPSYL